MYAYICADLGLQFPLAWCVRPDARNVHVPPAVGWCHREAHPTLCVCIYRHLPCSHAAFTMGVRVVVTVSSRSEPRTTACTQGRELGGPCVSMLLQCRLHQTYVQHVHMYCTCACLSIAADSDVPALSGHLRLGSHPGADLLFKHWGLIE